MTVHDAAGPVHQLSFRVTPEQRSKGYTCRCSTCGRHFRDALDVAAVACAALAPIGKAGRA